jgi:hypothetical protein
MSDSSHPGDGPEEILAEQAKKTGDIQGALASE